MSSASPPGRWSSRTALLGTLLLALAVHGPCLFAGFMADDFGQQGVLAGRSESSPWTRWNLYDFGAYADLGSADESAGAFPWWVDGDWRVRFLRPLSSASLALDHGLFGANALAGHASSLALFGLLLWAAARLFRRLGIPPGVCLTALLVLSFDGGSLIPVGWIANRNSLLEGLFAVLACHGALAARESGSRGQALGALALASLAVAAKESGLHVLLLLCWLFWRAEVPGGGPATRFPRLAMAAAVIGLGYVAAYGALGYGSNALFYPVPWSAPGPFLVHALQTLSSAPLAALSPFSADLIVLLPDRAPALLAVALALGLPAALCIGRVLRGEPAAGLLFLWGLAALLPQAGAPPSDRLMFTAMIPWSCLIALFLARSLRPPKDALPPRHVRVLGLLVGLGAVAISGPLLVLLGAGFARGSRDLARAVVEADVGSRTLGPRDVFLLQASPSSMIAPNPMAVWRFHGGDPAVRIHALQAGQRALSWRRTKKNSLVFESREAPFLGSPFEKVFLTRPAGEAARGGRRWERAGFRVDASADDRGRIGSLHLELESSADDPRWRFLVWQDGRLTHLPPPAVGDSLELSRGFKDPLLP